MTAHFDPHALTYSPPLPPPEPVAQAEYRRRATLYDGARGEGDTKYGDRYALVMFNDFGQPDKLEDA